MVFTHDTDVTLMHAAALANTGPALGDEDREELPDLAALLRWMDRWEWTGRRPTHPGRGGCRARAAPPAARDLGSRRGRPGRGGEHAARGGAGAPPAGAARCVRVARARHVRRRAARPADRGRGGHGAGRRHPGRRDRRGSRCAPATTARTCSSTSARTGRASSATAPAAPGPTSPPTGPARPPPPDGIPRTCAVVAVSFDFRPQQPGRCRLRGTRHPACGSREDAP